MDMKNRTFRAAQVCEVAGVSANTLKAWVGRGLLKLEEPNQKGWTRYTYRDLLRICAWAEVNRAGISPIESKRLVYEIEGVLEVFAFEGVPPSYERRGCYVLAEVWQHVEGDADDQHLLNVRHADLAEINRVLQESLSSRIVDFATVILVDTLRLWRRIEKTIGSPLLANLTETPDSE